MAWNTIVLCSVLTECQFCFNCFCCCSFYWHTFCDKIDNISAMDNKYIQISLYCWFLQLLHQSSPALVQAVRRDLAMAIRDLMQHGLMEVGQSSSLVPFGCFPNRSAQATRMLHAWDLFLKFYEMKVCRYHSEDQIKLYRLSIDFQKNPAPFLLNWN